MCTLILCFSLWLCNINMFILVCVCVCVCWWWGGGGEGREDNDHEWGLVSSSSRHNQIIFRHWLVSQSDPFCSSVWIAFSMPILEASALWNSMVLFERLGTDWRQVGGKFSPTTTGLYGSLQGNLNIWTQSDVCMSFHLLYLSMYEMWK